MHKYTISNFTRKLNEAIVWILAYYEIKIFRGFCHEQENFSTQKCFIYLFEVQSSDACDHSDFIYFFFLFLQKTLYSECLLCKMGNNIMVDDLVYASRCIVNCKFRPYNCVQLRFFQYQRFVLTKFHIGVHWCVLIVPNLPTLRKNNTFNKSRKFKIVALYTYIFIKHQRSLKA